MARILFKLMVQLKGFTCNVHVVLWLILTAELKNTPSNPQFRNATENAHNVNTLPAFQQHLDKIDSTGKIKFIMQIADEKGLESLDLKLKMNENSTIAVDIFSRPINSFNYTMPSEYYPSNNINNVP